MMPVRLSGMIFDLDGTLVDSLKDIATAVNLTRADLGMSALPEEEITRLVGDGFCEDLEIESHLPQVIRVLLSLELAADFLDLFEVKALEFPERDHVFCGPRGPKPVRREKDPDRVWLTFAFVRDGAEGVKAAAGTFKPVEIPTAAGSLA